MIKTAQQSLLDMLLQIMPALQQVKNNLPLNDATASRLYQIWQNAGKTNAHKFEKPMNIASNEISKMIAAGLIEEQGKYIKITAKGVNSLKVLILNDDSFALSKKASDNLSVGWYERLKQNAYLS
jgi:hypothetical protein